MSISAVINTYNEAEKLSGCLESVANLVDEIVVVDMGSTDETRQVAKKFKAKVLQHKHLDYVEPARNFAINEAKGDWILVLDPDERVPEELSGKLLEVSQENIYEAVNIPRKNIIFGKWIKHTNWWPDKHVRFFKKGKVLWSEKIHLYPKVEGKILELPALESFAIIHFNYETVNQFLERQNRYSSVRAKNRFDEGERFSWKNIIWNPAKIILQKLIRHQGFKDGFHGFALSFLAFYAQLSEEVKLWELEKVK